ncbi:osmotically inducible protein C [Aminobacter sp. DSM 101952]|uniref:OsmC family protein n=1 Tax=Aminobacter TaxID=31988 RepID=UPI0006F234E7|nr:MULTISPECIES: OsmC family protein [Aminobacter]AWC23726.1 OsmC-like protein [Aminobacter sp. MSH1]KQU70048.1 osmotically inducible protein C [Aminobacter sp. DSM 101952]CAI2934406.1 OsmC-like protein [Aminobacter niigataensis]
MLEYNVEARRVDVHGALATTKTAQISLGTDPDGRLDAFNPAELLLASVAACMIKGLERIAPMLHFDFKGAHVDVHAVRQDSPPKIVSIDYVLTVDTDETDQRLELLHRNVRKYGTISNTIAAATALNGIIQRQA